MNSVLMAWALATAPVSAGQIPTPVPPGTPVHISVSSAPPVAPLVSISLGPRQATVTPERLGFTHTGGGNIDVAQPSPDTVVITMTGVAVVGPHPIKNSTATLCFDLNQCFDVSFDSPKVKKAKLQLEGSVIGLLRSHTKGGGSAHFNNACGTVANADTSLATVCIPSASAGCGQNISLNAHEGPQKVSVMPGSYTLHQTFTVCAQHPRGLCPTAKAASAEFSPDPALDPLWISYWEPFHGGTKKDFGFQLTIKVVDDTEPAEAAKKPGQKQ